MCNNHEGIDQFVFLDFPKTCKPFDVEEWRGLWQTFLDVTDANPRMLTPGSEVYLHILDKMNHFLMVDMTLRCGFRIYVRNHLDEKEWQPIDIHRLRNSFNDCKVCFWDDKKERRMKPKNLFPLWHDNPKKNKVNKVVFRPDLPPLYNSPPGVGRIFNTWEGLDPSITQKTPEELESIPKEYLADILFHLEKVLCRGNQALFQWISQWQSQIVRFPGTKQKVVPIFTGPQGSGKSIWFEHFARIFGVHGVSDYPTERLLEKYNFELENKVFCCVNETHFDRKEDNNKLKNRITASKIYSEQKFCDARLIKDYLNMVWTSNDEDQPFPVEIGTNRRFLQIRVDSLRSNEKQYFDKLVHAFENGGLCLLYAWLRDLPSDENVNLHMPPYTEEKMEAVEKKMHPVERFWQDCLNQKTHHGIISSACSTDPLCSSWVTGNSNFKAIYERFKEYVKDQPKNSIGEVGFHDAMKKLIPPLSKDFPLSFALCRSNDGIFHMPDWAYCRDHFLSVMGISSSPSKLIRKPQKKQKKYSPSADMLKKRKLMERIGRELLRNGGL